MSTGRLRVIFDADIGPDPTDFTDRASARKATRVVLTVFGLYHAGAVLETMDPDPPTVGVDRRWTALEVVFIYLVEVVMYLVVLTMIAMVTAAATKPGVFVGVGLGCLVAGILAFLVAPEFAQNPNEPVYEPGNGGMGVALSIGFVLVVLGVVALFGALLGSLIKRIRRRNDPPRPSSAPSTHRRERSAHRPTTHRREGRGGPGSLAGGASP